MMKKAPGRSHREGLSLIELFEMFPTEEAATKWFEAQIWPVQRCCNHCGSLSTSEVPNAKPMPYWCKDCRSYFSVRTGTPIAHSKVSLRKWSIAIYICLTSLKSVSSMKLHRDIKVSQPTAWFMLHRIREAWADTGRGPVGKTAVVGIKDRATKQVRAKVTERVDTEHLQGFVVENTKPGAKVYTDDASAYDGLPFVHESVRHSVSEYVKDMAHTNGVESFWATLKRAHKGTFHKLSPKHLDRYIQEFAAKHNMRDSGTLTQMRSTVARLVGRNLLYRDLIADNGLSPFARD